MQTEIYEIVTGVIIVMIILLIAVSFIFILVSYSNKRKKLFLQEKRNLEFHFKEQLLNSQLEMQEQTFNVISQEIHDNVGQVLSLAKVQLNILEQRETFDAILLKDVKENIGQAMIDLRDIAKSLNSDRIKLSSLFEITNDELQRISRLGIETIFVKEGEEVILNEHKKLILLRILQESLQNIVKHANAKKISVVYKYLPIHLQVDIIDDGHGFDLTAVRGLEGLGLQNIVNRVSMLGGVSSIESEIGRGTQISILLPYA